MSKYINQVLSGVPAPCVAFISHNIKDLAQDNPKVRVLFTDNGKMNPRIREAPDESTTYVLINLLCGLVNNRKLSVSLINRLWANTLRCIKLEEELLHEFMEIRV